MQETGASLIPGQCLRRGFRRLYRQVIDGAEVFQIPFIIRDPNSTSDIVFQTNDETWQAYNSWGGADVYGGDGPGMKVRPMR